MFSAMSETLQSGYNMAQSAALTAAEMATAVRTVSAFKEKGVLTPEEFVAAGDKLVKLCPTWRWEKGDPASVRAYLPPDKQFLTTPRLPCLQRVKLMEEAGDKLAQVELEDEDGWLSTADTGGAGSKGDGEIASMDDALAEPTAKVSGMASAMGGLVITEDYVGASGGAAAAEAALEDDFGGMADFADESLADGDEATLALPRGRGAPEPEASGGAGYMMRSEEPDDAFQSERRYDLDITYDKYYQTPRVWLFGYDEENNPLGPDQIFEDISQDHANRTVTLEGHPHKGLTHATIHPCKHAATMKKMTDQLLEGGRECDVEEYMFLFLKFISCIIPTMEYDFTLAADLS